MNPSKAVLVGLNVYLASNNVRKNIGSFAINVQNANDAVRQSNDIILSGGGTSTFIPKAGNKITVVVVSTPLLAEVTFAGGGSFSKVVTALLVLDSEISQIVFTNQSTSDNSELTIING